MRLLQPGADMDVSATMTLPLRPGADMDMVSVSTKDTAAWFWVPSRTLKIAAAPTRCDGWQSQLFSPAHPLRLRMEEVRVEALVGGRKPVVGSREAVNRVGAPRTVQEGESIGPQRVVVLLTLRRVRKVVGAHIPHPVRRALNWTGMSGHADLEQRTIFILSGTRSALPKGRLARVLPKGTAGLWSLERSSSRKKKISQQVRARNAAWPRAWRGWGAARGRASPPTS